jgi:hypothetical protein
MQRVLIAWLVVRPDSANDHLFPGTGLDGLDVATINQVIAAAKSAEAPRAKGKEEARPSSSLPRSRVKDEAPLPPPPASPRREDRQAVPLDEIESLRKSLLGYRRPCRKKSPLPRVKSRA